MKASVGAVVLVVCVACSAVREQSAGSRAASAGESSDAAPQRAAASVGRDPAAAVRDAAADTVVNLSSPVDRDDASLGCAFYGYCDAFVDPLDARGRSPFGMVHATAIGVGFEVGLTKDTQLELALDIGGEPGRLHVTLPLPTSVDVDGGAVTYRSHSSAFPLVATLLRCDGPHDLSDVEVTTTRFHAVVLPVESTATIEGELSVRDAGWDLRVLFAIEHVCSVQNSL